MPVHYVQDDARRQIRITVTEPTTVVDLIGSVERQLADGAWRYGSLVDARAPLVPPAPGVMQAFAVRVAELAAAHGPRGPIAVVARDPRTISAAQRLAFSAGRVESIEVFWDLDDAQRWLDECAENG
jgi:hypothetical protein